MLKVLMAVGLSILMPGICQAKTLEDLLVEKGIITKSEAVSSEEIAPGSLSWKNGNRFSYPSEGITATVSTLLQNRYTFTDNDINSGKPNISNFDTTRARLIVSGTALHEEFSYVISADFVGTTDEDGTKSPNLKDAYVKWNPCDWAALKIGQFKTGISRQFNTNDAKLQFIDRSAVSDYLSLDRQEGLQASSAMADGMVEIAAAIFNGESDGEGINKSGQDTKQTGILNVRLNAMGKMDPYEEGDVNWTEETAISIGGAYARSGSNNDVGAGLDDTDKDTVSLDANLKSEGLSIHTEGFYRNQDSDISRDSINIKGFYIQTGYFLDPKVLEIAARYGNLNCDDGRGSGACKGNDRINDAAATLNYYFMKNNLKAQFGYELLNENPTGATTSEINTSKWIFQFTGNI
jgi:phosphate-selective porin OprO/OprP